MGRIFPSKVEIKLHKTDSSNWPCLEKTAGGSLVPRVTRRNGSSESLCAFGRDGECVQHDALGQVLQG